MKEKLTEIELLAELYRNPNKTYSVLSQISSDDLVYLKEEFSSLTNAFQKGANMLASISGSKYLDNILTGCTFRPIEKICEDVKKISVKRKFIKDLEQAKKDADFQTIYENVSELQRSLSKINTIEETSKVDSVISEFKDRQQTYIEKFKKGGKLIGLSTGYSKLDAIIDGFRPEHLWVVGGYTNMGKTATALNFCANLIEQGRRVVYFSLEMGRVDILTRLLGIMLQESGLSVLKGFPHNESKVKDIFDSISASDMGIISDKTDLAIIESTMSEEMMRKPVDLFVVDFIQNITIKGTQTEYERTSEAILAFQRTAKRLKVPILVLSQISNEGARVTDQVVMSFKGSGTIAAAADLAIEINVGDEDKKDWKQKLAEGKPVPMIWNVRKNRHGRVGSLDMSFDGRTGVFSLAEIEQLSK